MALPSPISVRLDAEQLAQLDAARGRLSRSLYLRQVVDDHFARLTHPEIQPAKPSPEEQRERVRRSAADARRDAELARRGPGPS